MVCQKPEIGAGFTSFGKRDPPYFRGAKMHGGGKMTLFWGVFEIGAAGTRGSVAKKGGVSAKIDQKSSKNDEF